MTRYLLSIYQPDGPVPAPEVLGAISKDLEELQEEMRAAAAWVFSDGLFPPDSTVVLSAVEGEVQAVTGPFVRGTEHLGGIMIVDAPDLDAALEWGRRLARATTLPVEVRRFRG